MSKFGIRIIVWCAVLCVVTFMAGGVTRASADGAASEPGSLSLAAEVSQGTIEPTPTDFEAAEELPHEDLGRKEAAELLEGVFEPEVEGPAGIYGDLHVEKFLAPNVAVIAPGEQPEVAGSGEEGSTGYHGATLMDSTLPLLTEVASGPEAVNLNLESTPQGLRPVNPLVEVSIPAELGEGIELPGPGIRIEPEGVSEARVPSTVDGSVAFYPNVAGDTDFAVAPDPEGVETLTQLRGPESRTSETYRLILPAGASLAREGEGAVVTDGAETLMTVAAPTALDASGNPVPTELEVEGDRVTVTTSPNFATAYPVLVDPLFESWEWYKERIGSVGEGWHMKGTPAIGGVWPEIGEGESLAIRQTSPRNLAIKPGYEGFWIYTVPDYETVNSKGEPRPAPETFISRMTASRVSWEAHSTALSPYVEMGLWGPSKGWASLYMHEGLEGHGFADPSYVFTFPNELSVPDVQKAKIGMVSTESVAQPWARLQVGEASIELAEPAASVPKFDFIEGPTGWLRNGTAAIHFEGEDQGLGLQTAKVAGSENTGSKTWTASRGCTGVASSPCPYYWSGKVAVEPESLNTGVDNLPVTLEDPLGHTAVGHVHVYVDHTAPLVTLSGSMTEQAKLGTALPSYTIHASASDGVEKYPQSGVAKMTIKIDGTVVDESAPGCASENCTLALEGTLNSEKYSPGPHSVEVTAVDALGNTYNKTLWIQLRTTSPPTMSVSGSLTEQSSLGVARPRYSLAVSSSTAAQPETSAKNPPAYVSSFGSLGTGSGQFKTAGGVAIGRNGRLWVSDPTDGRIEEFGPQGEYLSQFGTPGSGEGQLSSSAWNIAVDSSGDAWVADTGNNRVEEFSEAGILIRQFGTKGAGAGQFNSPECLAFDRNGNVWVSDRLNSRLEKFNSKGEYLSSLTIGGVSSLAITPAGELWVVQGEFVNVYSETGTLEKKLGRGPSPVTEMRAPLAVTIDPAGHVWVADRSDKVFEFGQAGAYGNYLGKFGAQGTGPGQFTLNAKATEIAADGSGFIWVSDSSNNRVQKWQVGLAPGNNNTEVLMDGKKVASTTASCMNEACRAATNWTLESSSYTAGPHTVTVKTTDGVGRSTTETLPIELQRDAKGPQLTAGGSLLSAPEGWVGQHVYEVSATASDEGSGVTQLELSIDGHRAGLATQECPNGGCSLTHGFPVNTAEYQGGSHEAALIATDGSGNKTTKRWTINVDPEGKATVNEVVDTLEAADETSESAVVAPTSEVLEPEQRAGGDDPGLKIVGGQLESTGVPDTTTIATNPSEGFAVKSPEGTTMITPMVASGASSLSVAEGVAGVAANVAPEVDSVIRPEFNGLQTFQAIRSAQAPETYSWKIHLAAHQQLRLANPLQAEVVYENGDTSFLITAEPAHDVTGATVPTSLEVSGEILTLRVAFHTKTYVYPVVAGAGWETSYTVPVMVKGPEDETQIREREEREAREREERERGNGTEATPPPPSGGYYTKAEAERILRFRGLSETIPAPEAAPPGSATASSIPERVVKANKNCQIDSCSIWYVELRNPSYHYINRSYGLVDTAYWQNGTKPYCYAWWNTIYTPELEDEPSGCGFVGQTIVSAGEQKHLTAYGRFTVKAGFFLPDGDVYVLSEHPALQIWVWPNGDQQRVVKHWETGISEE